MSRFLFLFFVFLMPLQVFSAVTIQCNNPKYAFRKLAFYSYSDPVSQQTTPVFTLETDGNGKAS